MEEKQLNNDLKLDELLEEVKTSPNTSEESAATASTNSEIKPKKEHKWLKRIIRGAGCLVVLFLLMWFCINLILGDALDKLQNQYEPLTVQNEPQLDTSDNGLSDKKAEIDSKTADIKAEVEKKTAEIKKQQEAIEKEVEKQKESMKDTSSPEAVQKKSEEIQQKVDESQKAVEDVADAMGDAADELLNMPPLE